MTLILIKKKMYKKPLLENARSSDPVISEREISNIFSNIESMFQFNKQLIKDLQRYLESPESTTIGDIFIEVVRNFLYNFINLF